MTQQSKVPARRPEASARRNGWTTALVALFGLIIWSRTATLGDLAPTLGLPAFFIGLALSIVGLSVRGRAGRIVLNRFLVAGEDLFISWGIWTAFVLGGMLKGVAGLADLTIGIAVGLFVLAAVCWTFGLARGRQGIADDPQPGALPVSAWLPLGVFGIAAVVAGIALMNLGLVLFGAVQTVVSTVGGFLIELPEETAVAADEQSERVLA